MLFITCSHGVTSLCLGVDQYIKKHECTILRLIIIFLSISLSGGETMPLKGADRMHMGAW